jgi:hypothetical protein
MHLIAECTMGTPNSYQTGTLTRIKNATGNNTARWVVVLVFLHRAETTELLNIHACTKIEAF